MLFGLSIFREVPVSKRYDMDMSVDTRAIKFGIHLQKKIEKLACLTPRCVSKIYDSWCPKRVRVT